VFISSPQFSYNIYSILLAFFSLPFSFCYLSHLLGIYTKSTTILNMFYSSILLSAFAATTALAAPTRSDNSIRVQLSGPGELATQTAFEEGWRAEKRPVGGRGPYNTVSLEVGKGVRQQGLRCQVRDEKDQPIVVLRNGNRDTTFADGDAGEWTFEDGDKDVLAIICDPAFVKAAAPPAANSTEPVSIRVQLSGLNELATQTAFDKSGLKREVKPANIGDIQTVELLLDAAAPKQDLRCQILDKDGKPITIKRGQNIDTTFADGDAGKWTLIDDAGAPLVAFVSAIICDPSFVKAAAPTATTAATPRATSPHTWRGAVPSVRVQLSGLNELAVQRTFKLGGLKREVQPGLAESLNSVSLILGATANQALRCMVLDKAGKPIMVQRGQNVDTTFADGGNGPWKFINKSGKPIVSEVSKVICDPSFKKAA
jgi:CTP:molybdopterin cytidylyltransferase MocA